MTITFPIELHNEVYRPYLKDRRKWQIYYGGAGSGKSDEIAQKTLQQVMSWKGWNGMVVRQHAADNHDSTFALYKQIIHRWGVERFFKVNESRGAETIKCLLNNNMIIFKGLDDVEKRKGVTFENGILQWFWLEEANETSERNLNQLDIRLRGHSKLPKIRYLSFNPIDENHWLKRRFFDVPMDEADGFVLKTTYKDNAFLDEEDKKTLEGYKNIDEYYYQVYCLGNWGNISNARVFKNVKVVDFKYTAEDLENVRHGMDFGFVHASTLMSAGYKDGCLYIYGEHFYKEHTNEEFIAKVKASDFNINNYITADSAEPDRIKSWNNHGYNVTAARKGAGSLKDGIDYLQSLPTIYIHKTYCPHAAKEFLSFKRKELKDGTIVEQFVELEDDTIAAVRYLSEEFWTDSVSSIVRYKRRK